MIPPRPDRHCSLWRATPNPVSVGTFSFPGDHQRTPGGRSLRREVCHNPRVGMRGFSAFGLSQGRSGRILGLARTPLLTREAGVGPCTTTAGVTQEPPPQTSGDTCYARQVWNLSSANKRSWRSNGWTTSLEIRHWVSRPLRVRS